MRLFGSAACLALAACSGSGDAENPVVDTASRQFAARDFTAVVLDGPDQVEVRTGSDFGIEARGEKTVLDQLDVRNDGTTLRIARKPESSWKWPLGGTAAITVQMPEIRAASVGRSGMLTLDRAEDFTGRATGSGDLTVGMLGGRQATLANTGSGTIAAAGTVEMLAVEMKGSGDIAAPELRAEQAAVLVEGSGSIHASVTGPAAVTLRGSGNVDLGNMAQCTTDRAGSGTVVCGL
jgi:hypothetical protein